MTLNKMPATSEEAARLTSVYAGHYQGDLRDLGGNALVSALIEVRLAGTATPANPYNNVVLIADAKNIDTTSLADDAIVYDESFLVARRLS